MPVRYDASLGYYRISCRRCGRTDLIDGNYEQATIVDPTTHLSTGRRAHAADAYRWVNDNTGRTDSAFRASCRACERRGSRGARVPRTNGAANAARRFGVELELTFRRGTERYAIENALTAAGLVGWRVKSDGSLSAPNRRAYEVVSPVLSGDDGEQAVRTACRVLRTQFDAKPNRTCGLHVHHEVRDLTIDQIKSVYRTWRAQQDLIDGLVSESRRGGGNTYCRRIEQSDVDRLDACAMVEQIAGQFGYGTRYRTMNLNAYGRYGTIEIRQHQGTCDAEKIMSWVKFGQAMIDTAAASEITAPVTTVRDLFATMGDRMNDTARTFMIGRAVEFGVVAV